LWAKLNESHSSNELLVQLEEHKGVIEATMTSHLGYSVQVGEISIAFTLWSGSSWSDATPFEICYATANKLRDPSSGDLGQEFQLAFDATNLSVIIYAASWTLIDLPDPPAGMSSPVVAIVLVVVSALMGASCVLVMRVRRLRALKQVAHATSFHSPVKSTAWCKEAPQVTGEARIEIDDVSISTGDPTALEVGVQSEISGSTTTLASIPSMIVGAI
jgi:hypothetical protein